jgi:signal transduction histidine kinase
MRRAARTAMRIEPGLLYVFRLFLAIQWALLSLAMCGILSKKTPIPDYESIFDWLGSTLLVVYLAWSWLRARLGRAYLPIALTAASLGPVGAQVLATALRIEHGLSGTAALADLSPLYVDLLLPLLLISAQYGMRALFTFTIGTSLLSLLVAVPMSAVAGLDVLTRYGQDAAARLVLFSIAGVIVVLLTKAQRKQRAEEAKRHAQVAQYATTLEQLAVTRERNRLARELHDTLAHTLSAVSVQLNALEVLWDSDPAAARATLQQTRQLTRGGLDEARRALHELRAQPVEELGLALALQRLAERAAQRAGLRLIFSAPPRVVGLRPEVEQHLYRIAEEALNNVVRHANARQLTVTLAQDAAGAALLTIADDGHGFDPAQGATGHYGLTGMRERAFLIGAMLEIQSQPRRGTTVRVRGGAA